MCCFGPDEKERQKIKDDELLDAAQSGDVKIARKQLETGAFRNCKESMYGSTPLHLAASFGHLNVVQLLCDYGADKEAKNKYGNTPLHWAAHNGHIEVMTMLLDQGADVDPKNKKRETPLHWAAKKSQAPAVRLLVERGALQNVQDNDGNSALDVADGEECRAALGAVALASATSRLSAILSNRRSAGGLSLARRVSSAARAAAEEDAAAVAAGGAATSVTKDGIEVAQEAPADAIEAAAMANAARPQGAVVPEEVASLLARLQLSAYARPLCGTLGLTSLAAAAYVTEPDLVRIGMKPLERRMFLSAAANGGELPKPRLSTAASADVWQLAPPGAVGEDGAPPQQLTFSIDPASLAAMLKGGAPASARISFVAASV